MACLLKPGSTVIRAIRAYENVTGACDCLQVKITKPRENREALGVLLFI